MKRMMRIKRPLYFALALVMAVSLIGLPVLSVGDELAMPTYQKVNVVINNEREDEDIPLLREAIEDALKAMGFGAKQIKVIGESIEIDDAAEIAPPDEPDTEEPDDVVIDTTDLSDWVVADHYDSTYWANNGGLGTIYNPPAAWKTANDNIGGTAASLRPYFLYTLEANYVGNGTPTSNLTSSNDNGAYRYAWPVNSTVNINMPIMKLSDWIALPGDGPGWISGTSNNNKRQGQDGTRKPYQHNGTNIITASTPAALPTTLGIFDRHLYSRMVMPNGVTEAVKDVEGAYPDEAKPRMDFVGYVDNPYVDYAFYPADKPGEDGKKTVTFNVDGSQVNAHCLYGAGFLVNAGVETVGSTAYISGYYLAYLYKTSTNGAISQTPTSLALFELKDGLTVTAFHNNTTSATTDGSTSSETSPTFSNLFKSQRTNYSGNNIHQNFVVAEIALTKDSNWWTEMCIALEISPVKDGDDLVGSELRVWQEKKTSDDQRANHSNPGNALEFTIRGDTTTTSTARVIQLKNKNITTNAAGTAFGSGRILGGFGPCVSYRAHGCRRATQFTYSNLHMDISPLDAQEFTVTYVPDVVNGVAVSGVTWTGPATQTRYQYKPLTITTEIPERTNYTFLGWCDDAAANYVKYHPTLPHPTANLPMNVYSRDHDVTLYAVWKADLHGNLIDILEESEFKSTYTNFFIDLTDGDKPDRTTEGGDLGAAAWMMDASNYTIRYITDTPNALLTDSKADAPMQAPDQGITVGGPNKWAAIAAYIVSNIPPCQNGINYYGDEVIAYGWELDAVREEDGKKYETMNQAELEEENRGFEINLSQETIRAKNFKIAAYSIDGGNKWKEVKPGKSPFDADKFPKMLGKNMNLVIAEKPLVKKATDIGFTAAQLKDKELQGDIKSAFAAAKGKPNGGRLIEFPEIAKRGKLEKFMVNYAIYADITGQTPGQWALSEKSQAKQTAADYTGTAKEKGAEFALTEGFNIAVTDKNPKEPNATGWGVFCKHEGIPVQPTLSSDGKPLKSIYLVKQAPLDNGDGTFVAGSKAKKVAVLSELKPTKYKIKAKPAKMAGEEVKKAEIKSLKLKKGDLIFAGAGDKGATKQTEPGLVEYVYTGLGKSPMDYNQDNPIASDDVLYMAEGKGGEVSLVVLKEDNSTDKDKLLKGQLTIWKAATAKKPASKKQLLPIP